MEIKIISESRILPEYETLGAAGMDIRAFLNEPVILMPNRRALIPTGLRIDLPRGFEAQIRARSGLAIKSGIGLVNGVGTIDCDYRGEIKIPLINWGEEPYTVNNGDRIAQIVISSYERITWSPQENLTKTARGEGGFGHTGK
ncbi:MAG: dUTP diphosphatase [Eubacteriales bacterium]|nr:dUTP diphosphatase [Eubacteriales bacterium]MDD4389502.1 dUTP diphosphatase [Eubacteriales bacterium]